MNLLTPRGATTGPSALPTAPNADGDAQDEFRRQLRWAWRVLWRGKHLVLGCLLPVMVPTFLYLQQVTPRYMAEARISIEAPDVRNALDDRPAVRAWMSEQVVQTEADLLTSTVIAQRAIDKLKLKDDPEFNPALRQPKPLQVFLSKLNPLNWLMSFDGGDGNATASLSPAASEQVDNAAIVQAFLSKVSVKIPRRSFIISVAYTSESREKSALIANTLADLYVLDRLEANFDETRRVADWLGERLEKLRQDVEVAETAAEEFRSRYGLRRRGEQSAPIKDQQLSELSSKLVIARSELAQRQARQQQVRELLRARGSIDAISDVLQSPLIQRLREQETQRSREMSEALKTYGERHPRILGIRADLEDLRRRINDEVEKVASAISSEVEVAATGVRELERQLDRARQVSDRAGEAEVRLRELERQADATRAVYEAFLTRFKREAEQRQVQRANARIISPAEISLSPSYPPKRSILTAALGAAVLIGVILVFLLDRLDSSVRSSDEAEELTGLPTVAMVPLNRRRLKGSVSEDILNNPRSSLSDAVRSLRTALDLQGHTKSPRIILITSSVPREGKTYVSMCLAMMFAKAHPRVLLIDADVHRPNMFRMLGIDGERGLVQILAGEVGESDVIVPNAAGSLDFLPAGKALNTAEIINGAGMAALIERLSSRYDHIIIDSPPVLAVADTRVLACLADQVIYLIKWNETSRDAVRNGIKLLRSVGAPLFGVVLSQVNQRKHDRYGYGDYGYYYGRYHEYYGGEER
ncbi:capsular exopolysaccharide synthesis family protein [Azospirillum fermentarium]|uniref:GumC family protein n=1 Tax=Azospirillum fermentarium TaxID=1233114 RepID=UPI002227B5B3|nr:polysaccharide biosynthesis tyrosine autokinase [Azospirillum fermentarium]MCW2249610.1 capsular exopolysaccharide synthesis family protein [Azospirillum fermentarium]